MKTFSELGVVEEVLRVIEEKRFDSPTEIQDMSIPLILEGHDVIAGAATGSGKTLAFSVGLIQKTQPGKGIQALVLTPTRELANQVHKVIRNFSAHMPEKLNVVEIYGGVAINPQMRKLETADIVVGTPGRILDHLERGTVDFSNVQMLVLDEADRMLDMGFIEDVERIMSQCPSKRQNLFYSATIRGEITKLAKRYMHEPKHVQVETYVDPSKLKQVYYNVDDKLKFSLLLHLLKEEDTDLVMVFCNSRTNTDFVAKNLSNNGLDAFAIHGGLSQAKRQHILDNFHKGKVLVMVCTDVAARGLDIKGVTHVYNYDIPRDSKQYVHRVGRTARAGTEGKAINILASRDYDNFDRVIQDNSDMTIEHMETPYVERVQLVMVNSRRGGSGGRSRFGGRGGSGGRGRSGGRSSGPRRGGNRRPRSRNR